MLLGPMWPHARTRLLLSHPSWLVQKRLYSGTNELEGPSASVRPRSGFADSVNSSSWLSMKRVPNDYWRDRDTQKAYFQWVANHLGIKEGSDWLRVTYRDIVALKGGPLLKLYGHSLTRALAELDITKYDASDERLRKAAPRGYWSSLDNQRSFFLSLWKERAPSSSGAGQPPIEFFYSLTTTEVRKRGGNSILNLHKGSLVKTLMALFPSYKWEPPSFSSSPRNYWKSKENAREYLESYLAPKLSILHVDDWYRVSQEQIKKVGGIGFLQTYGNLASALESIYPEYPWQPHLFALKGKKATQRWLYILTKKLFGTKANVVEEYTHPKLCWSGEGNGKRQMVFDVFVEEFNLVFEYQGEQHYHHNYKHVFGDTLHSYQRRDVEKQKLCLENGLQLIYVPYWWDGKQESFECLIEEQHGHSAAFHY